MTYYTCTCDNHTTRHPGPIDPHGLGCRRAMHLVPAPADTGNGTGMRGDDIPEVMARVAKLAGTSPAETE